MMEVPQSIRNVMVIPGRLERDRDGQYRPIAHQDSREGGERDRSLACPRIFELALLCENFELSQHVWAWSFRNQSGAEGAEKARRAESGSSIGISIGYRDTAS